MYLLITNNKTKIPVAILCDSNGSIDEQLAMLLTNNTRLSGIIEHLVNESFDSLDELNQHLIKQTFNVAPIVTTMPSSHDINEELKRVVTFGQYKDKEVTLGWILENNPGYIIWISKTVNFFHVSDKLVQMAWDIKRQKKDANPIIPPPLPNPDDTTSKSEEYPEYDLPF